jgi:hypothetical protein
MDNSGLTFEHVYNESITKIFNIITDIGFTIAILMLPFVLYIVFTQSTKEMNVYKWQNVYYMISSYGMAIVFSAWKPVYLFPTSFIFSTGTNHR